VRDAASAAVVLQDSETMSVVAQHLRAPNNPHATCRWASSAVLLLASSLAGTISLLLCYTLACTHPERPSIVFGLRFVTTRQ
jgi:hypothetical protein